MPPLHLLVKPASGLCNLRCDYCFYHDEAQKRTTASYGMMSEQTLAVVLEKALRYAAGSLTVAYQGGEPTLRGLPFFQRSIELQRQYNRKGLPIHNALQTNGYGLTEEWARFLAENRFLVGLSLDGKRETHDACRHTPEGEDTFAAVLKTARLFDRFGVDYNILTVVNAYTARRAESIYNFYRQNGFAYLQFIPCLDPLDEPPGSRPYSLRPKAYGDFLKTLFDLWYRDLLAGRFVSIRQFDNYVDMLRGYPPESCGMAGVCAPQHVIEADGSVYPCDFYVLDQWRLGNLLDDDFADLAAARETLGFVERSRQIDEACRVCRFGPLCRGGCRRYREPEIEGRLRRSFFCESYQAFFAYAADRLARLAASPAR